MNTYSTPLDRTLPTDSAPSTAPVRRTRPVISVERRAQLMCQMRAEGTSLAEIGDAFGLTRERVRQIIRDAGGPRRDEVLSARINRRERERLDLRERVLTALRALPGQTGEEVADRLGITPASVRAALGQDAGRLLVMVNEGVARDSDESLLADLRRAAAIVQGPLSHKAYEEVRRDFGGRSAVLMAVRFGYWANACAQAGVACGHKRRGDYTRRWTPDQMVEHVADYLAEPGSSGTYAGYDEYARRTASAPSAPTVRNTIGTWTDIKTRALIRLAERDARGRGAA